MTAPPTPSLTPSLGPATPGGGVSGPGGHSRSGSLSGGTSWQLIEVGNRFDVQRLVEYAEEHLIRRTSVLEPVHNALIAIHRAAHLNAQRLLEEATETVSAEEAPARVDAGTDVATLKARLESASGIPAAEQRLTCNGRILERAEARLAEDLGMEDETTVFMNLELVGGGKKRKKKTYTKPKKTKHKKKKVKLAVLKFYKVDSNDKVTRLRRECPAETCGPGVFMAMHFNRYYCGKCHLTYLIKKGDDA